MNRKGFGRSGHELLEVLFRMDWGKSLQTQLCWPASLKTKKEETHFIRQFYVCLCSHNRQSRRQRSEELLCNGTDVCESIWHLSPLYLFVTDNVVFERSFNLNRGSENRENRRVLCNDAVISQDCIALVVDKWNRVWGICEITIYRNILKYWDKTFLSAILSVVYPTWTILGSC